MTAAIFGGVALCAVLLITREFAAGAVLLGPLLFIGYHLPMLRRFALIGLLSTVAVGSSVFVLTGNPWLVFDSVAIALGVLVALYIVNLLVQRGRHAEPGAAADTAAKPAVPLS